MTDFYAGRAGRVEASDTDLAEQALPADGGDEADDADDLEDLMVDVEADPADVLEQHHGVPSADDDYDR